MAFEMQSRLLADVAEIALVGELDAAVAGQFRAEVEKLAAVSPARLVLQVADLAYMASAGLRVLVFARQKMGAAVDIYIVGAQEAVRNTIVMSGFHHSVVLVDTYETLTDT